MPAEDLLDYMSAESSPYKGLVDMYNETNDYGESVYTSVQKKNIESYLRTMAMFDMSIGHTIIHNAIATGKRTPSAEEVLREKNKIMGLSNRKVIEDIKNNGNDENYNNAVPISINELMEYAETRMLDTKGELNYKDNPGIPLGNKFLEEQDKDVLSRPIDPSLMKTSASKLIQSFSYIGPHIDEGTNAFNYLKRRTPMLSKKSAREVTYTLDRVASLFQEEYRKLGIPEKVANDFAFRCDFLSDHIEKKAGLSKEALSGFDPVKEEGFDPEEIGKEQSGPQEGDSDESYMDSHFSQQENRELRENQESGNLHKDKPILDRRSPSSGKQADYSLDRSLYSMEKEAFSDFLSELSSLSNTFQVVQARLKKSAPSIASKLSSGLSSHISGLEKAKKILIDSEGSNESLSPEKLDAVEKIVRASREVSQHLSGVLNHINTTHDEGSPTAQLKLQEMLANNAEKLAKLCKLSAAIINRASGLLEKSKKEAGKKTDKEKKKDFLEFLEKKKKEEGEDDKKSKKASSTLYALVSDDGYLYGASYDHNVRWWDKPSSGYVYELKGVPGYLAKRLIAQGTPDQFFGDGYLAWDKANSYVSFEVDSWGVRKASWSHGFNL
jgi:hypothetical protein